MTGIDKGFEPRGIEPEPRISRSGPPPAPGADTSIRHVEPAEPPIAPPAPNEARRWIGIATIVGIIAVLIAAVGFVSATVLGADGASPWSQSPVETEVSVEEALQAKIDQYEGARGNGALWKRIPDTPFNRTAVSAFLFLLTDMKLAASFGGDTTGYLDRADELEQKLLNEEPLGSDVEIGLSDRVFTYDGETGEGGYVAR